MIRATGLVKLFDFGIARPTRPAEADVTSATAMPGRTVSGMDRTPRYVARAGTWPGSRSADGPLQLWRAPAELLSGTSPLAAGTATDIIVAARRANRRR
jgi:hypothetical protein